MYQYTAKIVSVYDGDTLRADIDLGFGVCVKNFDFRLLGINAPEMHGASSVKGEAARDALRARVLGKMVVLETAKDRTEKYGRYLGKIVLNGEDINQWMIQQGYAVSFMV